MQFVFPHEIVCKMTTIVKGNLQLDCGPADGPEDVYLAVSATLTVLHLTEKQLVVCSMLLPTKAIFLPFTLSL